MTRIHSILYKRIYQKIFSKKIIAIRGPLSYTEYRYIYLYYYMYIVGQKLSTIDFQIYAVITSIIVTRIEFNRILYIIINKYVLFALCRNVV